MTDSCPGLAFPPPLAGSLPSLQPFSTGTLFQYFPTVASPVSDDDDYWGDSINNDPKELHRIYFQNIDGLRNDSDDMELFVSTMAQLHVGTFCWADPGLDFSIPTVRRNLQTPLRRNFSSSRCAFSSSTLPETSTARSASGYYQPGGTFTASTGQWSTRSTGKPLVVPKGLGRWSGLRFLGKQGKRLAILTAYRSPRQELKVGIGFHDQQYALLLSQGVKKPNVRRQFIVDLVSYINELQGNGYEVMVSLDANETLGQDKVSGLQHLIDECTLKDLHLQGAASPPATYKYGKERRIDYMLGSPAVAEAIINSGYNAYDNGIPSKHRGLYVDLDFAALMGSVAAITPPKGRLLRSDDQPAIDRYLKAFKKYADDHRLWDRVKDLTLVAHTMTTNQIKTSFDALDRDVTRGMLHAEKKAKRKHGPYLWSPNLRAAGLLARYWHLRLRSTETEKCLRYAIAHTLNSMSRHHINADDDHTDDPTVLKRRWKEACETLRLVRNNAYDHREIHLQGHLDLYSAKIFTTEQARNGEKRENAVKIRRIGKLIENEGMKKPFRGIQSAMSDSHASGISKLFVPIGIKDHKVAARFCDEDGSVSAEQLVEMAKSDKASVEYATLLDSDDIEQALTDYNRNWFRQAKDTPFGNGELYDLVGYDGLTESATKIVDGECIDHLGVDVSRELRVFLEECKRPASVAQISTAISTDQFVDTVKAWKESTSTSPSGRHLGHYRTAIPDPDVANLHTQLLNLPITHGFAPERWTHSVTPLIEKDDGLPYLTRLRVIHLFEADYNLFLKIIFGRHMVRNAEKAQALNDQQHGSRPRRMTTDALFLARLEKDLIRQVKANSAHMDNDATGCYDRIITSLGMIACRRLGMPVEAIRCQAETLRSMQYAVKHVYGTSSTEYSSSPTEPLFGTGQGSGASPAIWLGLVVILLNSLDRMSLEDDILGLEFTDPWNEWIVQWRVGVFVDDTNQGIMDLHGLLSKEELVEQMRLAGQMWENLLHISGGCLNLSKCSWTLQYWTWINGRPRLDPLTAFDPPLLMTSGFSPEHHVIRQHDNATELKGLGVNMNFLGTFSKHAETMRLKFEAMAHRLQKSSLSSQLAKKFYHLFYIPSVRYSLPVTFMTPSELNRIQSLMTSSILNKLGYNRHYPHAVAFAPTSAFGCGLLDLRIEQGLSHIKHFMDYVGTNNSVGLVMLTSLRQLQVEAGVSFDLLQCPKPVLPYLTDCWLLGLRSFCALHNMSLYVQRNKVPSVSREYDSMLMDKAVTLGLRKQELIDINLVRTFLAVTTVSDIATADGVKIHPLSWRAERIPDRDNVMSFARQEQPTPYQCGLWRRLLKSLLNPRLKKTILRLDRPLGSWTATSTMRWGSMLWDGNLYRKDPLIRPGFEEEERYISVHLPKVGGIYYETKPDWYVAAIPAQAIPCDLHGMDIFTVSSASSRFPSIPAPAATFHEWTLQLPLAERRLLSSPSFAVCDAEEALVQYLQVPCTLYIGTDGGKRHHLGSFSWVLCTPCEEHLIQNSGPVDGWHKCHSSLRSEAAAISSLSLYLDELATFHNLTIACTFQLYVDSTSAISNVKMLRDLIPRRKFPDNADLLSTISSAPAVLSNILITHVKSHQDDDIALADLPFSVQLNVKCDELATAHIQLQTVTPSECTLQSPLRPRNLLVEVRFEAQVISSHYVARLRECISLSRHRLFLHMKYAWPDPVYDLIAWDAFHLYGRSKNAPIHSVSRSKIVHNWLNLGAQRCKFGGGGTTLEIARCCPYCRADEDFTHLLTCPHLRAMKHRYEASAALLKAFGQCGEAGKALQMAVRQWTLFPANPVSPPLIDMNIAVHTELTCATESQSQIGWLHFFRGFVSKDWGKIYPAAMAPKSTEERQTKSDETLSILIGALQNYTISIWKSRNAVLHESGLETSAITHAQLNHSISQLYLVRSTFNAVLQSYFKRPLEDLLRQSPRQRQRWLRLARLATSHSSATSTFQQRLSTYFPYAPPPVHLSLPRVDDVIPCPPVARHQLSIPSCFPVFADD